MAATATPGRDEMLHAATPTNATMTHPTVTPDAAGAARAAARVLRAEIEAAGRAGRTLHLALAGGTTPRATYAQLASEVADAAHVHVWAGDERLVPPGSPESNAAMIRQVLIGTGAAFPPENLHAVPADLDPDRACAAYAHEIARRVPPDAAGVPRFDLVVLGVGEDGHTASLFPGSPALAARGTCVVVRDAPKPPPLRVSLTLPVLTAARRRLVLVTGEAKARAVAAARRGPDPAVPASLLPADHTDWILDAAAAALLERGA
jgi:6-phosphogluconolactonase